MLCTGLAILGLCFPLPGDLRTSIQAAGWLTTPDGSRWRATRLFASGEFRVIAALNGDGDALLTLLLVEPEGGRRIGELIEKHCSAPKDGERRCLFGARKVVTVPCADGWLMSGQALTKSHRDDLARVCAILETTPPLPQQPSSPHDRE